MVAALSAIARASTAISRAIWTGISSLVGLEAGSAATTPATPDPPVTDPTPLDPIIQPITDIVGSMSDTTMLILAGVAILAVYGAVALLRGRSA